MLHTRLIWSGGCVSNIEVLKGTPGRGLFFKMNAGRSDEAFTDVKIEDHEICYLPWLKLLLCEIKIMGHEPMELYCDNKVTIAISHNPLHHDRTKHVDVS